MTNDKPLDVRYATRYCALLKQDVEVLLTKRADGSWMLAHCVEKNKQCAGHKCPLHFFNGQSSLKAIWL